MAVLAKSDNILMGLSTDVKPTNFIPGSIFYETDTGKKFEWRGGAWVELDTVAAAIGEPVANPAANTLMARIKALETALAGNLNVSLSGSKVVDAVIAQNGTDSTEIDFRNYKYMAIQMPAAWDAATLTIKGSAAAGGTKQTITNDVGVAFPDMTVAANGIYAIDLHALKIAAIPYLALVASAAQTTAARTIKVMLEQ